MSIRKIREIRKHRFCIYEVHTKSPVGELPEPLSKSLSLTINDNINENFRQGDSKYFFLLHILPVLR